MNKTRFLPSATRVQKMMKKKKTILYYPQGNWSPSVHTGAPELLSPRTTWGPGLPLSPLLSSCSPASKSPGSLQEINRAWLPLPAGCGDWISVPVEYRKDQQTTLSGSVSAKWPLSTLPWGEADRRESQKSPSHPAMQAVSAPQARTWLLGGTQSSSQNSPRAWEREQQEGVFRAEGTPYVNTWRQNSTG